MVMEIIDGVDVSKCGFFHLKEYGNTDCHIALAFSEEYDGCIKCEQNPNCYFKELERAKALCEILKQDKANQLEEMKNLNAENEDIKQTLEQLKMVLSESALSKHKLEKIEPLIMELEDIVPYVAAIKSELAKSLLFKIAQIIDEV